MISCTMQYHVISCSTMLNILNTIDDEVCAYIRHETQIFFIQRALRSQSQNTSTEHLYTSGIQVKEDLRFLEVRYGLRMCPYAGAASVDQSDNACSEMIAIAFQDYFSHSCNQFLIFLIYHIKFILLPLRVDG